MKPRTIGAFVNFSADYLEPGLIHFGGRGAFYIGELDGSITPRLQQLQQALAHWGNVQMTDNIWGFLWGKQAYGAMLFATALTNDSMADAIDQHRRVAVELAREVLRVAAAIEVRPLGFDGFEPEAIGSADRAAVDASLERLIAVRHGDEKTHSGVWRDMAVRKRRTEVDAHFGPIVADAQRLGLDVPLLERMVAMIHEVEEGRRAFSGANLDELEQHVHACARLGRPKSHLSSAGLLPSRLWRRDAASQGRIAQEPPADRSKQAEADPADSCTAMFFLKGFFFWGGTNSPVGFWVPRAPNQPQTTGALTNYNPGPSN